jgi:hypothetical protein
MTDPIESLHGRGRPAPTTEPATSAVPQLEQMRATAVEGDLIDAPHDGQLYASCSPDAAPCAARSSGCSMPSSPSTGSRTRALCERFPDSISRAAAIRQEGDAAEAEIHAGNLKPAKDNSTERVDRIVA